MSSFIKTIWTMFVFLLLIHILALAGGAAWLWNSGRLDRRRVVQVVDIFRTTIAQDQQKQEEDKKTQEAAKLQAQEAARLLQAGNGPADPLERLNNQQRDSEVLTQRVERLTRERQDLLRQLELHKDLIAKQEAELATQRKAFETNLATELKQRDDRDFQQAVQMYEQIPAKQVKGMFQTLLKENKVEQVVDYLAAMQLRKAAAVLKEFKAPADIPQATDLVQRLRMRGIDLLSHGTTPSDAATASQPTQPSS